MAAAATTQAAGTNSKQAAPVALRPFFTGTLDLETHTQTYRTLSAASVPLPTFYPKTNGFLADLWIRLAATGGATRPAPWPPSTTASWATCSRSPSPTPAASRFSAR
jgi:hypothetical protein